MAGSLEATVVLSRCSRTKKLFGMRAEKRGNAWVRTWAFAIDETRAKNEGFFGNTVSLRGEDDNYPGCPDCKDRGFVKCGGCGKIGCSGSLEKKGGKMFYTCPWCKDTNEIEFSESIDVSGGGY